MKSKSLVNPRTAAVAICAAALFLSVLAPRTRADEWNKRTTLTTNQTLQIRDTVLPPGKYTLKLLNSESDRHIVQIFNGDDTKFIATVFAVPAYRLDPTGRTQFTFWETPPGMAKALHTWYYPGDNYGQEFPYPKQLVALNTSTTTTATTTTPVQAPPAEVAPPATQPVEPPATASNNEENSAAEMTQPEEPQPTGQQPAPTPSPTPAPESSANRSTELPATASPYPAIGAMGLLSLLGFAGLRLKRAVKS